MWALSGAQVCDERAWAGPTEPLNPAVGDGTLDWQNRTREFSTEAVDELQPHLDCSSSGSRGGRCACVCVSKPRRLSRGSAGVGLSRLGLRLRNEVLETKAYNVVNIRPPDWPACSSSPSHQSPELIRPSRTLANEAAMQMLNKTIC